MRELIEWIISNWNAYWGDGFYQYLLLAAALYLIVQRRKEKNTRAALVYSLLLLLVFAAPVSAAVIRACLGDEVYWRVLWLLPAIPLIALAGTDFLRRRKTKAAKFVLLLVFSGVIALSGRGMFRADNFAPSANPQKVPSEVAYFCNFITEKAAEDGLEEVRLATDEYLSSYIRVYDASILMPYGRRGKGALGKYSQAMYDQINAEEPSFKRIARAGKRLECHFIIMDLRGQDATDTFAAYGYTKVGELHKYTIFQLTLEE